MTPRLVAHRGASLWAPENTFAAASKAIEMGATVIELDVRESAEGTLYVMHDLCVDRTTDGSGPLHLMSDNEISALDAGSWYSPDFRGQRVPRLDAYLDHLADQNVGAYVEIKWANAETVAGVLRDCGMLDQIFTFSFKAEMRDALAKAAPEIRRMITLGIARNMSVARDIYGASMIELEANELRPQVVAAARSAGLEVMGYSESSSPAIFQRMIELGVNYINHDHLDLTSVLLESVK